MKNYISEIPLLEGFSFPEAFLVEINQNEIPFYEPWFFFCETEGLGKRFYERSLKDYPSRNIIPFARYDGTDDVACFDGGDRSGNPKVYIVHFFASAGWEDRGSFPDFESWLVAAKQESLEYIALRNDDN